MSLNLALYLHYARRWVLFAALPALLCGAAAYAYTNHKAKVYEACATLYVEVPSTSGSGLPGSADIYNSTLLAPTYSQMATDPVVLSTANRALAARYPGYQVGTVKASQADNTQLVSVCADDTMPRRTADAANAVAAAFITRVKQMELSRFTADETSLTRQLDKAQSDIKHITSEISRYRGSSTGLDSLRSTLSAYQSTYSSLLVSEQDFRVTRDAALNGVSIYSPATVPGAPIGPHPMKTAILAAFVVLLLAIGAIYLYDYFDDSLRNPEEVEEIAGAPLLTTVPRFQAEPGETLVALSEPHSALAEAYRRLRINIQFLNLDFPPRTLLVTSPSPQEGKSTTASNLAQVMADAGQSVTLIDCDLRRPSVHRIFQLDGHPEGLTNLLLSDELLNGHGTQLPYQPNLTLLASGPIPPRPPDLLGTERMRSLVMHARDHTDVVLLDSPPILAVSDAAILATMVDGVILVVDTRRTMRRDLKRAREAIEAVGGKVVGVVINRLQAREGGAYYYYGHQYVELPEAAPSTGARWAARALILLRRVPDPTRLRPRLAALGRGAAAGVAPRRQRTAPAAETPAGKRLRGRPARIGPAQQASLQAQLEAYPAATLAQHCELWEQAHGTKLSVATMDRSIARLGWTRRGGRWVPPAEREVAAAGLE